MLIHASMWPQMQVQDHTSWSTCTQKVLAVSLCIMLSHFQCQRINGGVGKGGGGKTSRGDPSRKTGSDPPRQLSTFCNGQAISLMKLFWDSHNFPQATEAPQVVSKCHPREALPFQNMLLLEENVLCFEIYRPQTTFPTARKLWQCPSSRY